MKIFALAVMAAAIALDKNATPATEDLEEITEQNTTFEPEATHEDLLAIQAEEAQDAEPLEDEQVEMKDKEGRVIVIRRKRCYRKKRCYKRGFIYGWYRVSCYHYHTRVRYV